jgi:toxin-antitoxin system, toxin component, Txe/YoeB family
LPIHSISPSRQKKDIQSLKKSETSVYKKLIRLLEELTEHPTTGIGKPEKLKHELGGLYSRRLTQKHRLVYRVDEERITVLVISALGHYG